MAINPQKLLPPSKLTTAERMAASYDKRVDDVLNFQVKEKLINVDKFLKNENKEKKRKAIKGKLTTTKKKREKKEESLETPKGIKGAEKLKSLFPKTGILDAVQRFATYTFLGYLLTKFQGDTPKLLGILKQTVPVLNVAEKIVGGIFEGVVGFVDAGYKAYDQMRSLSKDLGGDKAQKTFDQFGENFNRFLNAVLTFGLSELGRGNQKPPEKKSVGGMVRGYANGGRETRGGKIVGGAIGRTLKQERKLQIPKKVQPEKTNPGKDVGGKLKIQKLFPDPKPTTGKRQPNPYKALTGVSDSLDKGGWIGALMAAGVKIALGQKVDSKRIATSVASGVGSLSQANIQQGRGLNLISSSILGFADGGMVLSTEQNTKIVGNLLATLIQSRVNDALKNVTDELIKIDEDKQPSGDSGAPSKGAPSTGGGRRGGGGPAVSSPGSDPLTPMSGATLTGLSNEDYKYLAYGISGEAGPGDDMYAVAASILNRVAEGRGSVKKVVLSPGQYEAITKGTAGFSPDIEKHLQSPEGQAKIAAALYRLQGRTDFKGQTMLGNRVSTEDPMVDARGNFYHYSWQSGPGSSPPRGWSQPRWKKFIKKAGVKKVGAKKVGEKKVGSGIPFIPPFMYSPKEAENPAKLKTPKPQKVSSIYRYPSYDSGGTTVAIQPIIFEKPVPVPSGGSSTIAFPIPMSVNNNMASLGRA
jgi:hypothetical protein